MPQIKFHPRKRLDFWFNHKNNDIYQVLDQGKGSIKKKKVWNFSHFWTGVWKIKKTVFRKFWAKTNFSIQNLKKLKKFSSNSDDKGSHQKKK